jgi:hypothetical protein
VADAKGKRGDKTRSHDIASQVRGAFLRTLKMSEANKRPLSLILLDLLNDDPKACLDAVARFVPKEMLVETTIVSQLDELSDEAIAHEIGRLTRAASPLLAASGVKQPEEHRQAAPL